MTITFVSLNLWHGGQLLPAPYDFLKQQNADIVALQEVYNGEDQDIPEQYRSMEVLKRELGLPYADFVPDYLDFDRTNGKAQRGNAIVSRFPITAYPPMYFNEPYSETYRDVPAEFPNCPRSLQRVSLATPAGDVNVFNIQGVWDLDGDNFSQKRENMANMVVSAIQGLPNVILAGDTNAKPTNKAIKLIEEHLKNVFTQNPISTFNMRRKDNPGYATAAVDMILVSPNITVLSSECPDVDISDHLPLVAKLEIK